MPPLPWHAIKIPLLLLLAAVLLSGTGEWWSSRKLVEAEAAHAQQTLASQATRLKLQRSNTEKQFIQQYRGPYQALVARGFAGVENLLAWLEAVQQANRDAQLYGLDYSLEPRAPVSTPANTQALGQAITTVALGKTAMKVRMPILVEDDLRHFLDALQQRTSSVFRVRRCEIAHPGDSAPQPLNQPELEVECELLWFTVSPVVRTIQ